MDRLAVAAAALDDARGLDAAVPLGLLLDVSCGRLEGVWLGRGKR